jgi:hypothetical protein
LEADRAGRVVVNLRKPEILAMCNVIIQESLYQIEEARDFLRYCRVTKDVNASNEEKIAALKAHLAQYTPDWAEGVSGVAAATIRRIAIEFTLGRPSCVISYRWAITGNKDTPGTRLKAVGPHWASPKGPKEKPKARKLGILDGFDGQVAFTGAERRHIGRFEMAKGGTIFLDEVAEIPPEVQVKLLRILQERKVERVGGGGPIPLDVRVLAATQVDLEKAMKEGRFRPDLYWRLNVIHVAVTPLRDRPEDVVYLARKFVTECAQEMGKPVTGISASAEARLLDMPFPGNVRELKNVIERAVAFCAGPRVQIHDLFPFQPDEEREAGNRPSLKETVEDAERAAILGALGQADWAIGDAAEALGISRKNLWEKMKRHGIGRET